MKSKVCYKKSKKRLGRGHGSGHGKTSTKGHKGQRARSGFSMRQGFEGGQTPLYRKLPKRGFSHADKKIYSILNLEQLEKLEASEISPEWLLQHKVIKRLDSGLKILGRGELKRTVTVRAHRFSAQAKAAIEKAGGQAILIGLNTQES